MKRLLYLILAFLLPNLSEAQRTADIAVSGGVTNYIGDLANEKHFPTSSANTGAAITIRNFLNNPQRSGVKYRPFDLQLRFSWHRLQYDETNPLGGKSGSDLRNYLRGLGFRNDLFGSEIDITYNFFLNKKAPLSKPKWMAFVLTGVGVFYGEPKADLFRGSASIENRYFFWNDGTVRDVPENPQDVGKVTGKDGIYETDLRSWMTEGQGFSKEIHRIPPYDNCNLSIPFGAGIRYIYNKNLALSLEFNYYHFFTDYLDDASTRYATWEELRAAFPNSVDFELAKYISDPTGRGTNGFIGPVTSPRGNPEMNDSFAYLSLEASWKINWKKKGIYGQ